VSLIGDEIDIVVDVFDDSTRETSSEESIVDVTVGEEFTEGDFFIGNENINLTVDIASSIDFFDGTTERESIFINFFNDSDETVIVNPVDVNLFNLDWLDDPNGFIADFNLASVSNDDAILFETLYAFGDNEFFVEFPEFDLEPGEGDGVEVQLVTECFLSGTHILTNTGEVAVEDLNIGDLVKTVDGKLEPIKWIGKQTVQPNRIKNPLRGYPILIKAGALGHGLPTRDLYTSPDHAYLVEGLLINAGALVNDVSIIKTEPTETFCYYHVELEDHALLVAEGAPAESFYPNREDRLVYDNGAEYDRLYPYGNSQLMLYPLDYPRISSMNKVPRYISEKLMQIAEDVSRKTALVA